MSGDWKSRLGMVYSTDPDFKYEDNVDSEQVTLPPSHQDLRVWIDRRQRAGKVATVVKGFVGSSEDLSELARLLKIKCGVGGTAKDGDIVIQGDHRDRIIDILVHNGYKCKKAGS